MSLSSVLSFWIARLALVATHAFFVFFLLFLLNDPFHFGVPTLDAKVALPPAECTWFDTRSFIINLCIFSLLALQHSGMARPCFKRAMGLLHSPLERPMYALVSVPTFVALLYFWEPLTDCARWDPLVTPPLVVALSGSVSLITLGTILIFFYLFPDHIFGTSKYLLKEKGKPKIINQWPYNMVRHPTTSCFLYFFWFGIPSYTLNHVFFSAVISLYIFIGTALEERDLHREFGKDYAVYSKKVGQFFPRLTWFYPAK